MDKDWNLSDVEVFLNVADLSLRSSINIVLRNHGARKIQFGQSLAEMSSYLELETPDLLICSTHFPDGELYPALHDLRHHKWGKNPFVPIITVTNDPNTETVKLVLESGADDLLIPPISTNQLLSRIDGLAKHRKQFVVTTDYVGPTRRSKGQSRGTEIPMIDVPNTLKTKISGERNTADLANAIELALAEINVQKIERHGVQLVYLAERIVDPKHPDRLIENSGSKLDKLIEVAEEARSRMMSTKYEHTSTLCGSLLEVAYNIREAGDHPAGKDLNLLNPIAQAIQVGFTDSEAANAAHAIADSVARGD